MTWNSVEYSRNYSIFLRLCKGVYKNGFAERTAKPKIISEAEQIDFKHNISLDIRKAICYNR